MKTANVRTVQHNLAKVLKWVSQGEEVKITRRNEVVARIVPGNAAQRRVQHPDFVTRARKIWGEPRCNALSKDIIEQREDRI